MKDEIKDILDKCTPFLFGDEVDKLTDYITNLQEENKRLKQWDCNKDTRNSRQRIANAKQMKQLEDYKSRCEKAIEYINNFLEREYFDYDILETNTIYNRDLFKVKNILNGDDKE